MTAICGSVASGGVRDRISGAFHAAALLALGYDPPFVELCIFIRLWQRTPPVRAPSLP